MNYVIVTLHKDNIILSIDKAGDKYVVGYYNQSTHKYNLAKLGSLREAYMRFNPIARALIYSKYTEVQHRIYLIKGRWEL
jgi:hypothetical protein